jgi:hypothetical protein
MENLDSFGDGDDQERRQSPSTNSCFPNLIWLFGSAKSRKTRRSGLDRNGGDDDDDGEPLLFKNEIAVSDHNSSAASLSIQLRNYQRQMKATQNLWSQHMNNKQEELAKLHQRMQKEPDLKPIIALRLVHIKQVGRLLAHIEQGLLLVDRVTFASESLKFDKMQIELFKDSTKSLKNSLRTMGDREDVKLLGVELSNTMKDVERMQQTVNRSTAPKSIHEYDDAELMRELNAMFPPTPNPTPTPTPAKPPQIQPSVPKVSTSPSSSPSSSSIKKNGNTKQSVKL